MKYIVLMLFITFSSCSQNVKISKNKEDKIKIDTVVQYKFIKTINDIDFEKLNKVEESDLYLKKIREFSISAEVYEIESLELNKNFKTKIYLVWQEAAYTTLYLVNISIDNKIIDETELITGEGDGNELTTSTYSFIDNKHIIFTKYYSEYEDIPSVDNTQVENVLKTIDQLRKGTILKTK
jgi:hypothetical protein